MQSLIQMIGENQVILFFLLFARISGLFAFFPFFSHASVPISLKMAMSLFLVVFLFPLMPESLQIPTGIAPISLALLSELLIGFVGGLLLNIVLGMLQLAGMQISFVMGFTMASVMDPQTNMSTPLMSQFLALIGIMVILASNGHHQMLLWISNSIEWLPLGVFYPKEAILTYLMKAVAGMFLYGFILSFPVVAFSLLLDVLFGMLMKTMPQFNLLVVGFPIKIGVSFIVLVLTLASMMLIFKQEFFKILDGLNLLLLR